ncbi:hypothetical protein ACFO9E_06775 [Streptomyces maoxianensis]|uniref:Uncharacterized protein n=1 Tax=Streptomyces maoxianensis TaxID=1459942 RepID=A0ABV9FZS0_9ACTN
MTIEDFRPTHVVPQDGLPAWEEPDVSRPAEPLDPLLPVQLVDRRGDWGRIVCANGWSAWVDGRLLVSVPQEPPAAGQPLARTADPRPLLARVEETLGRYRRAAEDLAAGRTDGETFRRGTQGLRVGMVVDGESVWLYDAEHERWVYCDGTRLSTYAAPSGPAGGGARGPAEPTMVAPAGEVPGRDRAGTDPPGSGGTGGAAATRTVEPDEAAGTDRPGTSPPQPGGTGGPEPTRAIDTSRQPGDDPHGQTQALNPEPGRPDGPGAAQADGPERGGTGGPGSAEVVERSRTGEPGRPADAYRGGPTDPRPLSGDV